MQTRLYLYPFKDAWHKVVEGSLEISLCELFFLAISFVMAFLTKSYSVPNFEGKAGFFRPLDYMMSLNVISFVLTFLASPIIPLKNLFPPFLVKFR
jgi:hypothetical protein